jgi:hypothetical protein
MILDDPNDFPQFVVPETARPSNGNRVKPELGLLLTFFNMDVDGLCTVQTEKEEAISFVSQNRRHSCILPQHAAALNQSILVKNLNIIPSPTQDFVNGLKLSISRAIYRDTTCC